MNMKEFATGILVFCFSVSVIGCSRGLSDGMSGTTRAEGRGYPYGESNHELASVLHSISTDSTYGYTEANPVKVGGIDRPEGRNMAQQRYLSALLGPNGEPITFEREGSCCYYESEHGYMGWAALDVYRITYQGLQHPVRLYLTLYDFENPEAPLGFTYIQ